MEPERNLLKPSKEKYVETAYSPSCKKRFFLELKYFNKLSPSPFSRASDASNGWFSLLSVGSGELFQHLTPWSILGSREAASLSLSSKFPPWHQGQPSEPHTHEEQHVWVKYTEQQTPAERELHGGLYISLRNRFPWSSEQGEFGRGAEPQGSAPASRSIPLLWLPWPSKPPLSSQGHSLLRKSSDSLDYPPPFLKCVLYLCPGQEQFR